MFHHDHQKPLIKQDFGGPVKKRGCTDLLFAIAFLVFWVGMIATGTVAFKNEQYKRVTNGWDINGNICGTGACADYPMRFFPFDVTMPGGISPYFSWLEIPL